MKELIEKIQYKICIWYLSKFAVKGSDKLFYKCLDYLDEYHSKIPKVEVLDWD